MPPLRVKQTHAITNVGWTPELRQWYADSRDTGLVFQNMGTLFGHVIRSSEAVVSNEPAGDPRATGVPAGHPAVNSFLGVPLLTGEHRRIQSQVDAIQYSLLSPEYHTVQPQLQYSTIVQLAILLTCQSCDCLQ